MFGINKQRSEEQRRRILARMRFKSLVRKTMINNYWLSEMEDQKLGDNVKRNVAIIMKRKGERGLLSILLLNQGKTILNLPAYERTKEQMQMLIPVLLDLACFERFPPIIRAQLVGCLGFNFVNKQRIIIREEHHASAVYFILNGEVNISQKFYDQVLKTDVEEVVGKKFAGDMFGELAIMKNRKRNATVSAESN